MVDESLYKYFVPEEGRDKGVVLSLAPVAQFSSPAVYFSFSALPCVCYRTSETEVSAAVVNYEREEALDVEGEVAAGEFEPSFVQKSVVALNPLLTSA